MSARGDPKRSGVHRNGAAPPLNCASPRVRAARLNLPRFHITQYGRTVLGAEPVHPLDPDRYLARIEDRVAERLDSRLIAGSAIRRMCTSWAAICVCVLLVAPAPSDADDLRLLNVGVRGGTAGPNVIGGDEDERFEQYDVFATATLPWSWYRQSGWGLSSRLMATAGALAGAETRASSAPLCPF